MNVTTKNKIIDILKIYANEKNWKRVKFEDGQNVNLFLHDTTFELAHDALELLLNSDKPSFVQNKLPLPTTKEMKPFPDEILNELNRLAQKYGTFHSGFNIFKFDTQYKTFVKRFLEPLKSQGLLRDFVVEIKSSCIQGSKAPDGTIVDLIKSKMTVNIGVAYNAAILANYEYDFYENVWKIIN